MDWQVIILTLGASIITGAVSLAGNIIASRANVKKSQLEDKSEYMHKRFQAYDSILKNLNYLECNISNKDVLKESKLEEKWLEHYHYCSKEVNMLLYLFIRYFNNKDIISVKNKTENIREQMKSDMDTYYGIKEKTKQDRLRIRR